MNATVASKKFKELLKDILTNTTIKLGKVLEKFIFNCVIAIVSIRGRVNFLQLMRYSNLNEKTYRNNFSKFVDWVGLNESIALQELPDEATRVVAIDPAHIDKSGKRTTGIGRFWSGKDGRSKVGLEIMAIAAIDYSTKNCVMLGAQQTIIGDSDTNSSMIKCYIETIRKHKDNLLKVSKIMVADAFFARNNFVEPIVGMGFAFVSRLQSNCILKYIPTAQWLEKRGVKRGAKPKYAGRVDIINPDPEFLGKVEIKEALSAWTGVVWSNALQRKVKVVIVTWKETGTVVYFSTDTDMEASTIVAIYQCRFQIEFGIRDGRQFTGLHHSQARDAAKLGFAFNISFFARNILKTEIDKYYPKNSVGQLKKAISDTEFALRVLDTVAKDDVDDEILEKINHIIASYIGVAA